MAIDVCSEISTLSISPRISFSHDLNQSNAVQNDNHRLDSTLSDSNSDFNFCIVNNLTLELSSADELFSNGKILPVQIKTNFPSPKQTHKPQEPVLRTPRRNPVTSPNSNPEKKRLKEFLSSSFDTDEDEKPPTSKSFWQFRRSSSLNFDTGKSLIRSLQFLSRSNSTGSAPNPKQNASSVVSKQTQKQNLQKQSSINSRRRSSSSSSSSYNMNNFSQTQKPFLRKSLSGSNGNNIGIRVSPVLNLPHPYNISKVTISFFGIGSFFCNGKDRKKKK
ncbi:hypothetical protein UlMin_009054 [Ulmus minor]